MLLSKSPMRRNNPQRRQNDGWMTVLDAGTLEPQPDIAH